jgi:hypothetical protein
MARKKVLSVAVGLCVVISVVAALYAPSNSAETKYTAKTLWAGVQKKWDADVNSYTCGLFSWTYRTESYIKNFPEYCKPTDKPDWDYRGFQIRFKKPGKSLLRYEYSLNEDTESGTLIDKGIAYMLKYASGTTFNYGYRNDDTVYIVFPYLTNSQFEKLPVPLVWKAMMKVLMIASRKEVYWKPPADLRDLRGNEMGDLSIGKTMKRYDHYFKDGKVTLSMAPLYSKDDFVLDEKTGWISKKPIINKPNTMYMLTMTPNSVKANKGITKVEAFIDPKLMMFCGLIEYEGDKPIQVLLFSDIKVNADLPDKLWEDYFKGRTLSDKKDSD